MPAVDDDCVSCRHLDFILPQNSNGDFAQICFFCAECDGLGEKSVAGRRADGSDSKLVPCPQCSGAGWIGVLPELSTTAIPGSPIKAAVLRARNVRELSLWHPDDAEDSPTDKQGRRRDVTDRITDAASATWLGKTSSVTEDLRLAGCRRQGIASTAV